MTTDKGLYRWLKQINVYGVSLIQNMPAIPGQLEQMIEKRIGKIHTTIYGRTFDVVASETPINQAYTSDALQLHMDLVFYENMPGLQLLHCITSVSTPSLHLISSLSPFLSLYLSLSLSIYLSLSLCVL
jgi:gamma-butyrobetaine dioxygenase